MWHMFHEGGWGMYAILLVGIFLVMATVGYIRGKKSLLSVVSLGFLTFFTGVLGFFTGIIKVFSSGAAATASEKATLLAAGVAECTNNLAFSFFILAISALVMAIGSWKKSDQDF